MITLPDLQNKTAQLIEQIKQEGFTPEVTSNLSITRSEINEVIEAGYPNAEPICSVPAYDKERYDAAIDCEKEIQRVAWKKITLNKSFLKTFLGDEICSRAMQDLLNISAAFIGISFSAIDADKAQD